MQEIEINQLQNLLQNKQDTQIQTEIQTIQQSLKDKMNQNELEALRNFSISLARTGMFLPPQNQKTFVCHVDKLIAQKKDLQRMIAYSIEHNCLWICDDNNDIMGMQCLERLWECVETTLQDQEQEIIEHVSTKHRNLLLQFMSYRQEKGRAMNEFSLKRLCFVFNELEQRGISVINCVNQITEFYEVTLLQQEQGVLYTLVSVGSVETATKNLTEAEQTALTLMRETGLKHAIIKNANEKHRVGLDHKQGLVKW